MHMTDIPFGTTDWLSVLTELDDGRTFVLTRGMSFQVGDDREPHRSSTRVGAKLFIVD